MTSRSLTKRVAEPKTRETNQYLLGIFVLLILLPGHNRQYLSCLRYTLIWGLVIVPSFQILVDHLFIMGDQTTRFTANYSYPGVMDQMSMCLSNRSRLDSGTSGSSDSSKESGKPPRRRSHRPRGCRGGSSRRSRNNSADEKQANSNNKRILLPINNSQNTGCDANNINNDSQVNTTDNNKLNCCIIEKGTPYDKGRKAEQNQLKMPGASEFPLACRPNRQPPGLVSSSYIDYNSNYYQGEQESFATASSTDYSSTVGSYDNRSYYSSSNTTNSFSVDFPPINNSFSDASSEVDNNHAIEQQQQQQRYRTPSSHNSNKLNGMGNMIDNDYILPPLPINAFQRDPIPTGPNPYALKLTSRHNSGAYYRHSGPQQHHQQRHQLESSLTSGDNGSTANNIKIINQNDYNYAPNSATMQYSQHDWSALQQPYSQLHPQNATYDYTAERIEKQRQNVEGGSLFVVSPRSFLMGWKRTDLFGSA